MKRNLLSLLLLFGLSVTCKLSNAQQFRINWQEEQKIENQLINLFPTSDGGCVKVCYLPGKGNTVSPAMIKYNKEFKETKNKAFEVDDNGYTIHDVKQFKNNIFMFLSKYEKKENKLTYMVTTVNALTLEKEGETSIIYEDKDKNIRSAIQPITGNYISVDDRFNGLVTSQDSTKILLYGTNWIADSKDNSKHLFCVVDQNGHKLFEKIVEMPYPERNTEFVNYFVSNSGSVGAIYRVYDKYYSYDSKGSHEKNGPIHDLKMILYNPKEDSFKEYSFNTNGKFVQSISYAFEDNKDIYFFLESGIGRHSHKSIYGIYTFNKENKSINIRKEEEFSQELLDLVDRDGLAEKKGKDKGLDTKFNFKNALQRENGSIDFIIKHKNESIYGDIININLNNSKSTVTRIPFYQMIYRNINNSFITNTANNNLYFFYNDDLESDKKDINDKPVKLYSNTGINFHNTGFFMAKIDVNGVLTRKLIYSNKTLPHNLGTAVQLCKPSESNKLLLIANEYKGISKLSRYDIIGQLEY